MGSGEGESTGGGAEGDTSGCGGEGEPTGGGSDGEPAGGGDAEDAAPTVQLWYATNDWPTTDDCTKIARFSLSLRSPTTYATSTVAPASHAHAPPLGRTRAVRVLPLASCARVK